MNHQNLTRLLTLFTLTCAAPSLCAQTISVGNGSSLSVGDSVTVTYSNPARAGQTITIEISGDFPVVVQSILITLDDTGKGSGSWTVADWPSASFNGGGASQVTMPIL